jgi:hypothetical protein
MQNYVSKDVRKVNAFITKLEDIPGGGVIVASELTQSSVEEGTPVGVDSNGLYHVVKTAIVTEQAANDATAYKVGKGHNFKVGDFIASKTGAKAYAITSINTSETDYDTLNVGTTLGVIVAVNEVLIQAAGQSATTTSAFKYPPVGLTGTGFDIVASNNHTSDIVVRGSVKKDVIVPTGTFVQAALPLIRFV